MRATRVIRHKGTDIILYVGLIPPQYAASFIVTCTHELRPGTTVCLYCRHEAHLAREAGRRRTLARIALGIAAVAVLIGGGVTAAKFARGSAPDSAASTASDDVVPPVESAGMLSEKDDGLPGIRLLEAAPVPHLARSTYTPRIAVGRTDLGEGMFAVRVGDTVHVHFDTELGRTRRPPKFERTVRRTLPLVFGAAADALLARIPEGTITAGGDLVRDLPSTGIRLDAGPGLSVLIHPVTRPGRDGAIVVAYRVVGKQ